MVTYFARISIRTKLFQGAFVFFVTRIFLPPPISKPWLKRNRPGRTEPDGDCCSATSGRTDNAPSRRTTMQQYVTDCNG